MKKLFAVFAALALDLGAAHAYHPVPGFHNEATEGGGARIYYTGSPRWEGADCGSCHVGAPRQIRFHLSSTPEDLFTTGRYEPDQIYRITIGVTGAEGKGLRTWMLETLDDNDLDVGNYLEVPGGACVTPAGNPRSCLQPSCRFMCLNADPYRETCNNAGQPVCEELVQIPGCGHCGGGDGCSECFTVDGVVGGVTVPPPWVFDFVAPPAGTGPINVYFGGVAGTSDHSSEGDDYQMQAHRLCESDSECAFDPSSEGEEAGDYTPPEPTGACAAASTRAGAWWLLLALLISCRARRRVARRRPGRARPGSSG